MERENGYYWVWIDGKPIVAEYENGSWKLTGQYMRFFDNSFEQILERKLLPPTTNEEKNTEVSGS